MKTLAAWTSAAAALLVLGLSDRASAQKLEGTWELVEMSPVSMMDSSPRGMINRKEYYAPDGKMWFVPPDKGLSDGVLVGKYSFDGHTRHLASDEASFDTPVVFLPGNRMKLTHGEGDEWTYARVEGERAYDRELEPRSVMRLKLDAQTAPVTVAYDTHDYSALPLERRIEGVWELAAVKTASPQNVPPYGFPNLLYISSPRSTGGSAWCWRSPMRATRWSSSS